MTGYIRRARPVLILPPTLQEQATRTPGPTVRVRERPIGRIHFPPTCSDKAAPSFFFPKLPVSGRVDSFHVVILSFLWWPPHCHGHLHLHLHLHFSFTAHAAQNCMS